MFFKSFIQFFTLIINYNTSRRLDGRIAGLRPLARLSVPNLIKLMPLWMLKNSLTLLLLPPYAYLIQLFTLDAKTFFFSVLLLLTTFLMICLHFPPLRNLISVTNLIVTSALTPNMLLIQSLGGTRNGWFILASIAWHWITSLFPVSLFIFQILSQYI